MPDLTPFLVTGFALGAIYALAGLGLVVLYRATGELNFTFGAVAAVSAMVTWQRYDFGLHIWLACLVVPSLAAAILGGLRSLWLTLLGGLVIGMLEAVATPFQSIAPYRSLAPFIVAIAVLMILPATAFRSEKAS